jgi:3'(2'), 5'-bisphosphate nucleotidase
LKDAPQRLNNIEKTFAEAAISAGREIMSSFQGRLAATQKADGSPVTNADLRAEAIIRARLREALPDIPVIGEEGEKPAMDIAPQGAFILVDPLDGTRDFLDGSPEFTVNIALVEARRPVVGVVHAPALGRLFVASVAGAFEIAVDGDLSAGLARRRALTVRALAAPAPLALESRSHREPATEALLAKLGGPSRRAVGSSLKFALLAAGEGDLYARAVSLNEWDIAAGDAVLTAAGGAVVTLENRPVLYGNPALKAPPFIAFGDQAQRRRLEWPGMAKIMTK